MAGPGQQFADWTAIPDSSLTQKGWTVGKYLLGSAMQAIAPDSSMGKNLVNGMPMMSVAPPETTQPPTAPQAPIAPQAPTITPQNNIQTPQDSEHPLFQKSKELLSGQFQNSYMG